MSHIVCIRTQVRDSVAIEAACRRLSLPEPTVGEAQLFGTTARGTIVRLPQWRYPLVCDTGSGEVHYDTFEGRWGHQRELDRFLQAYAVEKAKLEARKRGYSVTEQTQQDGSIRVQITT